jgi:2'-5' RNA ligase
MRFLKFYTEKENVTYKSSSTQIDFPDDIAEEVMAFSKTIPEEFIYNEDNSLGENEYGREDNIHTTVLYGITSEMPNEVKDLLKTVKPFEITLGNISFFNADKYDVMKIEIESKEIHILHDLIKNNITNEETWPEYNPHSTIAYVTKDYDKSKLNIELFKGKTVYVDTIIFSSSNGDKTEIKLKESQFENYYQERNDTKTINKIDILIEKLFKHIRNYCNRINYHEKAKKFYINGSELDKSYDDLIFLVGQNNDETGKFYYRNFENIPIITANFLIPVEDDDIPNLCNFKTFDRKTIAIIKNGIAHELTHYFDNKKYNITKNTKHHTSVAEIINSKEDFKNYFNSTHETNAYFIETSYFIFQQYKKMKKSERFLYSPTFDSFKKYFLSNYSTIGFNLLNDINKKKLYKRIYSFYNEFKSYFNI